MRTELAFITLAGAVFALCAKDADAPYETKTWINEDGDTIESRYYKPFDYGEIKTVEIKEDAPAFVGTEPTEQPKPMPQKAQSAEGERKITKIDYRQDISSSGALTLSIPIPTAEVVDGAPEIELSYNSQAGDGIAGFGWNIGGLSTISVANKSCHFDQKAAPADLSNSNNSAFALDGIRLIEKSTATGCDYVTFTGFDHVKKHMNGNIVSYFTVKRPDGTVSKYGYSANQTSKLAYPITETTTPQGYKIYYDYAFENNAYRLTAIRYGGKTSELAKLTFEYSARQKCDTAYASGRMVVQNAKVLTKINSYAMHEGSMQLLRSYELTLVESNGRQRLVRLDCQAGTSCLPPLLFNYEYYTNTGETLVSVAPMSVSQYFTSKPVLIRGRFFAGKSVDGLLTYPSTFRTYDWISYNLTKNIAQYGSPFPADQQIVVVPEIGYISPAYTITAEGGFQFLNTLDINGDGKDELVKVNFEGIGAGNEYMNFRISRYFEPGTNPSPSIIVASARGTFYNVNHYDPLPFVYWLGDFVGNGKGQLLAVNLSRDPLQGNHASYFTLIDLETGTSLCESNAFNVLQDDVPYMLPMDVDGDGQIEICRILSSGTCAYKYDGEGFVESLHTSALARQPNREYILGDINGDGLTDIAVSPTPYSIYYYRGYIPVWSPETCPHCGGINPLLGNGEYLCRHCGANLTYGHDDRYCRACGTLLPEFEAASTSVSCPNHGASFYAEVPQTITDGGDRWKMYLSTGAGFVLKEQPVCRKQNDGTYELLDVNGDGMSDMVELHGSTVKLYMNRYGRMQQTPMTASIGNPGSAVVLPGFLSRSHEISSFCCMDGAIIRSWRHNRSAKCENLVTSMVDCYGASHAFSYYPWEQTCSNNGYSLSYPYSLYSGNEMLLYSSSTPNGTTDVYTYFGATVMPSGYGFVGFHKIIKSNALAAETTVQEFDPTMLGVLKKTDDPKQTVTYTYARNETSDKVINPRITQMEHYDKATSVTTTRRIPAYGTCNMPSVILETSSDPNTPSRQTTMNYSNTVNSLKYQVGLVTQKITTSTLGQDQWKEKETMQYDTYGRLLKKNIYIGASSPTNLRESQSFTYNSLGCVLTDKKSKYGSDFLGDTYAYSSDGRCLLTKTDYLGRTTTYSSFNKFCKPERVVSSTGAETNIEYDQWGEETASQSAGTGRKETAMSWLTGTGVKYKLSITETGRPDREIYYDEEDRVVRESVRRFDGAWQTIDREYDYKGQLSRESLPYLSTSQQILWKDYTYDQYGRLVSLSLPSGRTDTWSYSGLTTTECKEGLTKQIKSNSKGQPVQITDDGGTIDYLLRPDGQISSLLYNNSETSFVYDNFGRKISISDPSSGTTTTSYAVSGDSIVTTRTNARGQVSSTCEDIFGLKRRVGWSGINARFEYDSHGRLTRVVSTDGYEKNLTYDIYDRVVSEKETHDTPTIAFLKQDYTYSNNNISSIAYSNERGNIAVEQRGYAYGTLKNLLVNNLLVWTLQGANALGQETSVSSLGHTFTRVYSSYGFPVAFVKTGWFNFHYQFNPHTGNLSSKLESHMCISENYGYDSLNRLVSINNADIEYSDNGNIVSWDNVGNFSYGSGDSQFKLMDIESSDPWFSNNFNIVYNALERTQHISCSYGALNFTYNPFYGERSMTIVSSSGLTQRDYYLDHYETDRVGTTQTSARLYIGGDFHSAPIVLVLANNSNSFTTYGISRDYLGNIVCVFSGAQTPNQLLSYTPYGRLRTSSNSVYPVNNQPQLLLNRGYGGHEHLPYLGLVNMGSRIYDPGMGRFLSPDPIVQDPSFTQNLNRYAYCYNNPLKFSDPNGEIIISFFVGFFDRLLTGQSLKDSFKYGWKKATNQLKLTLSFFTCGRSGFAGAFEIFSKFTYQFFQNTLGWYFGCIMNLVCNIEIHNYKGAIYAIKKVPEKFNDQGNKLDNTSGMTLGHFINIFSDMVPIDENGHFNPIKHGTYMHEYGHYLQSQKYGLSYIYVIGIPSLLSASFSRHHSMKPYERQANRYSANFHGLSQEDWEKAYPSFKFYDE